MVNPNPFESVVMAILVEHEKTIRDLRDELQKKEQQKRRDCDECEKKM